MMNPIFVVIGAPAVGKSTTSRTLAMHFPKSIHIPVEDLRHMVVSGLELPRTEWSDELTRQVTLGRENAIHMALAYHQAGFVPVLDDFLDPNHLAEYRAFINQRHIHRIVLYPSQEEAHRRNLERSGQTPAREYIDEGIRVVYQQLRAAIPQLAEDGWLILDTTTLNVEQTVATILQDVVSE